MSNCAYDVDISKIKKNPHTHMPSPFWFSRTLKPLHIKLYKMRYQQPPADFFYYQILPRFGLRSATFAEVAARASATIRGSAALQAAICEFWHDADIDIYCPTEEGIALLEGYLIASDYRLEATPATHYNSSAIRTIRTYVYPEIHSRIQLILYNICKPIRADIAAAGFILDPVTGQLDMCGHSAELLTKRITYLLPDQVACEERVRKYKERGFVILKEKPAILECCKGVAPLLRDEKIEPVIHSSRYFSL